ncbi:hypothetical protein [Sphingomonas molluscorum]|uniref:hypothetical protein n=1 Tax=Sphingomonas molluscorum TaxID=418184 RepID=UPI0031DE3768
MAEIGFADLVEVYRNTRFTGAGEGILTIADEHVAGTIRTIEADEDLYDLTQISLVDPADPVVGTSVSINVAAPSHRLGVLAQDFDRLFLAPGAAFEEPLAYYVIDAGFARGDASPPGDLVRYRVLLGVIAVLRNAATYVGELQRELVFIGNEKIEVPIAFTTSDLPAFLIEQAERLRRIFDDPLHADEKTGLLADAVIEIAAGQRRQARFTHLITNLDRICDEVERGYRLFVSSFSYSKIRKEIETAKLEYIGKIHKTIVDIQGQLLGIPVATIVVASQLKRSEHCDAVFWTNSAVLLGAWIFVVLLGIAIKNQWHTLAVIGTEIDGQRERLSSDHAAVRDDFIDVFDDLEHRIGWHRKALIVVSVAALVGAILATMAFLLLTARGSAVCLISG